MFSTILDSFKTMIVSLGDMIFSIYSKIGATSFIVGIAIIGIFVSFVVLNRSGIINGSANSDKVMSDRTARKIQRERDEREFSDWFWKQ